MAEGLASGEAPVPEGLAVREVPPMPEPPLVLDVPMLPEGLELPEEVASSFISVSLSNIIVQIHE